MRFNRIIRGLGWPTAPNGEIELSNDRLPDDAGSAELAILPTLFMCEGRDAGDLAYVGSVQLIATGPSNSRLRYSYDPAVPPIAQNRLVDIASEIGLSAHGTGSSRFDWTHTRWSVQNGDLYRALFRLGRVPGNMPKVFDISSPPAIAQNQLSVMMPFGPEFSGTYETIRAIAAGAGMVCNRADDIWENHNIIQDVVSLIDRSRVVICDVSGRNANVFYETGIAHALGREVILIARHASDVPFDIAHIRYIPYLPNEQGLIQLGTSLAARVATILART